MDELDRIVADGRETHGVEFKGPLDWADDATKATVTKACLALANKRDGGYLIIGMSPNPTAPGHHLVQSLSASQAASFEPDKVMAKVNAHAQPSVDLSVVHREVGESRIVAVVVREFREYPVMCSQPIVAGGKTLAPRGGILTRSRRMPESTLIQSSEDLRDIIDLAIEKGVARHAKLRTIEIQEAAQPQPNAADLFRAQLGGL